MRRTNRVHPYSIKFERRAHGAYRTGQRLAFVLQHANISLPFTRLCNGILSKDKRYVTEYFG